MKKATEEAPKRGPRNQKAAVAFLARCHGNNRHTGARTTDPDTTTASSVTKGGSAGGAAVHRRKLERRIRSVICRAIEIGQMSPDEVRGIVEEALSPFVNEIPASAVAADNEAVAAA